METDKGLPWEEAAEERSGISGWCCKTCNHFYGQGELGERVARYCHAKDAPCSCGKRRPKYYTCCDDCRKKHDAELWEKMPEVEWDGEIPLCLHLSDTYFFHADEMADWLLEAEYDYLPDYPNEGTDNERIVFVLGQVRLCLCREVTPRHFDLVDFLADHDEEAELDADGLAAEKAVNDWIDKMRKMYTQDNRRPSLASVKMHLGL